MKTNLIAATLLFYSANIFAKVSADKRIMLEVQNSTIYTPYALEDLQGNAYSRAYNMAYGNIGFDLNVFDITFKSNSYFNVSQSSLYKTQTEVMNYAVHPSIIVTRDIFKAEGINEGEDDRTQYLFNQFEWAYGDSEIQFFAGRMWLDFGEGDFVNVINPFESSTKISSIMGVEQAVDGMRWQISRDEEMQIHIYILGDKRFEGFEEKITRTAMIRGQWQARPDTRVIYILGEDQERQKYGAEIFYTKEKWKVFAQGIRFSKRIDLEETESENLGHFNSGLTINMSPTFDLKIEHGTYMRDKLLVEDYEQSQLYLPVQNFTMLQLDFNYPEDRYSGNLVFLFDNDSESNYIGGNLEWELSPSFKLRYFHFSGPNLENDDLSNSNLAYFPEMTNGLALRAQF